MRAATAGTTVESKQPQQCSVLYPTEGIAGLALALGAIVGVVLPLVMHAVGTHGARAGAAPPVAHA